MKILNYVAWTILILFSAVFAYVGTRALHFNYPVLFIFIAVAGTMIVILLFSMLKNIG